MLPIIATIAGLLIAAPAATRSTDQRLYSIPTSEEVRAASMAARDEGYNPDADGTFLDELRTPEGKELHPGYETIGLYSDGNLIHSYSIRIETGDIVDARTCQLFQYPNLLKFKHKIMTGFGTDPVSVARIAEEVGCPKVDEVHVPPGNKR
jgi:hypothetical protein